MIRYVEKYYNSFFTEKMKDKQIKHWNLQIVACSTIELLIDLIRCEPKKIKIMQINMYSWRINSIVRRSWLWCGKNVMIYFLVFLFYSVSNILSSEKISNPWKNTHKIRGVSLLKPFSFILSILQTYRWQNQYIMYILARSMITQN